jgi:hypothetical protein
MIASLDDLVAYTQAIARTRSFRKGIRQPGCPPERVRALAELLPGIPATYLSLIGPLHLDGVTIGYFRLFPEAYAGSDLVARVVSCNAAGENPLRETYCRDRVYQVASWEADPICVVHTAGPFAIGQTVLYNIGDLEQPPHVLANTFAQFLLLLGNLDAVRRNYSECANLPEAMSAFQVSVNTIMPDASSEVVYAWKTIAEEAFS